MFEESRFSVTSQFALRRLQESDVDCNLLPLLQQLSDVGRLDADFFRARIATITQDPQRHLMIVVEDVALKSIVGAGTLLVEPKFTHDAGFVGHLEDLVVDHGLRRKGIGRRIVAELLRFAERAGCYKVLVDCSQRNEAFYVQCGFENKGLAMGCYVRQAATDGDGSSEAWHLQCEEASQQSVHTHAFTALQHFAPVAPETQDSLVIRTMVPGDFARGFLPLLSQLTVVGDISEARFDARLALINDCNTLILVVEDTAQDGKIVGAGTLVLEQKLIHSAGLAGHIEDVVVDANTRGKGLGKIIIDKLKDIAFAANCYKVILNCDPKNAVFYEKCGFRLGHSPVSMAKYF